MALAMPDLAVEQTSTDVADDMPGVAAPDWDAIFTRTSGWTGADGAYSIDLGDGRTLWLFSDTWIGSIKDGRHAPGSGLVNNSIAIHRTPAAGQPPAAKDVTFYWGPNDPQGRPTAWIVPDPNCISLRPWGRKQRASLGWYWLLDGAVVRKEPTGRPTLVLFLARIGKRAGNHGVWGFKGLGGALAVIDNPHEPANTWRITQRDNPHAIGTDAAAADGNLREISWGAAVYADRQAKSPAGDTLYVYGVKETAPLNKQLLLARAPASTVHQFDTWRFWAGPEEWSPNLAGAKPVADQIVNELSVDRVVVAGRPTFVMVHSEPVFGHHILLRTARTPWGPWSKPTPVYDVPGVKRNKTYFTYAAKAHAHLSEPGSLLITYVINSHDFGAMVRDPTIYRPRFIRVPLDHGTCTGRRTPQVCY